MLDDWHPALHPLPRVGHRFLIGALGGTETLQAHLEARLVHHREHAGEALILLAHQIANRSAVVAVGHDTGGTTVNTQLVLNGDRVGVVALAQ